MASNSKARAGCEYAALGWYVVKLWGLRDGGSACACGNADCGNSRGKHPNVGKMWQTKATTDEATILEWFEGTPDANLGVLLGEKSGIIDLEFDCAEGERTASELLGTCVTPTFRSAKSIHRIFRYESWMRAVKASVVVRGVEVRIGNDKGTQSVFPPSAHWTGRQYEWLPGLRHDEVAPIALPAAMRRLILPEESLASDGVALERHTRVGAAEKLYLQPLVRETIDGRDNTVYAEACRQWREKYLAYGSSVFDDHEHQSRVYEIMAALNSRKCLPPLGDDEVRKKCDGARRFVASQIDQGEKARTSGLTALGLECRDGEWHPGQWRAEIMESDPPIVKLYAPFLPAGSIELKMEEYDEPNKVHLAVLKATGSVCLSDRPGLWPSIWNGCKKKGAATVGLKAKLLASAGRIEGFPELNRGVTVAEFFAAWLAGADSNEPRNSSLIGRPFRDGDGNVWFRFSELMRVVSGQRLEFNRQELSRAARSAGVASAKWKAPDGKWVNLLMASRDAVSRLEKAASGE